MSHLTHSTHPHLSQLLARAEPTGPSSTGLPSTTSTASETASSGTACVTCSDSTPVCDCKSGESCVLTSRTCTSCPSIQCIPVPSSLSSSSGGGSNLGTVIGPVVAAVVLVGLTVAGWWWWRRRKARDLRLLGFSSSMRHTPGSTHSSQRRGQPTTFRLPSATSSPRQDGFVPGVPTDVGGLAGDKERFGDTYSTKAKAFAVDGLGSGEGGAGAGTRRVYLGNGNINLDTYSDTGRGGVGGDGDSGGLSGGDQEQGLGGRPRYARRGSGDPFDDGQSVATSAGMSLGSTNVIPITYVPTPPGADGLGFVDEGGPGNESIGLGHMGPGGNGGQRDPATALEEARRAAFGGGQGPMVDRAGRPIRPAREPGLDLRLKAGASGTGPDASSGAGPSAFLANLDKLSRAREAEEADRTENVRNSTYTGKSVAPSFFSGTSEAPMIMTSRQVQVGMRQAAEVINLADAGRTVGLGAPGQNHHHGQQGRNLTIDMALTERAKQHQVARANVILTPTQDSPSPVARSASNSSAHSTGSAKSDPFGDHHQSSADGPTPRAGKTLYPPSQQSGSRDLNRLRSLIAPPQAGTFGVMNPVESDQASVRTGQATKAGSAKISLHSFRLPGVSYGGDESGFESSFGQRDSVSTLGIGSVVLGEARKVQLGPGGTLADPHRVDMQNESEYLASTQNATRRPAPVAYSENGHHAGEARESMLSTKSFADSLLGSFPMIIPTEEERNMMASAGHQRIPTSTSNNTISSNMAPRLAPVADSPLKKVNSAPVTAVPFTGVSAFPKTAIPPPTTALPPMKGANGFESGLSDDHMRPGRQTMGMSMASQGSGLGGFEFKFS